MKVKLKFQVILAFSFRLPMIALSVLHLRSLVTSTQADDTQSSVTASLLYLQAMLAWSLISATIPNMRGFMKSFGTRFGMPAAPKSSDYRHGYPMVTLTGTSRTTGRRMSTNERSGPGQAGGDDELTSRSDQIRNNGISLCADNESQLTTEDQRCGNDNGSQESIIVKELSSNDRGVSPSWRRRRS